jgi:glutamate synthase domain-containing protein 1
MRAREELMKSDVFGDDIKKFPNTRRKIRFCFYGYGCRTLLMTGRSLPEVMMMVVPEAWKNIKPCLMTKAFTSTMLALWSLWILFHLRMEM